MGDEQASESRVAAALKDHGPLLARVCMALVGDRDAATRALEQVAREAATKALPDDPRALLLGLARNACAVQTSRLPLRTQPPDDAPRTARMGDEAAARARAELATLRPTEREAVVLHVIGGLDPAGIAAACGIDEGAARARLARGITQLAARKAPGGEGEKR